MLYFEKERRFIINNVLLVGKLIDNPKLEEDENGQIKTIITLAIFQECKNSQGIREKDLIRCVLWNGISQATKDYCQKDDIVGIKGKLHSYKHNINYKEAVLMLEVIVDKISFLTSKK